MPRYPVSALPSRLDDAVLSAIRVLDEETESPDPATIALTSAINQIQAVSTEGVEHKTARDLTLQKLIHMVESGFPASKASCPDHVREYFRYREDLSVCDGLKSLDPHGVNY